MGEHGAKFYQDILDHISFGVYVLDRDGNYIYTNRMFQDILNMSKEELLRSNTHLFVKAGLVDFAASAISLQERRPVPLFQDIYDISGGSVEPTRQLIMATPIFGETGELEVIVGSAKRLKQIDAELNEASRYTVAALLIGENSSAAGQKMICESRAMRTVVNHAKIASETDATILISGASGTGKEVLARYIHESSKRSAERMVTINCAALPDNLLEAELFGYEKGAFTGASPQGKAGLFELADRGTLFLDEINSLPLNLQGKLLRAIESKAIQRLGSTRDIQVDFRLLAATNENLEKLVDEKTFRADLFYRLNVVPIHIPTLQERRADILPLAEFYLNCYCKKYQKEREFGSHMRDYMVNCIWPGNIRELKNFVERSVIMSVGYLIDAPHLNPDEAPRKVFALSGGSTPPPAAKPADEPAFDWQTFLNHELERGVCLKEFVEHCERAYLHAAVGQGKSSYELSSILKTSQTSIMRKKKKYGI